MTCIIYVFILEQLFVYNTGLIPSQFYEVLGGRDRTGFKHLLVSASLLILGTAFVSKKRDICRNDRNVVVNLKPREYM